MVSSVVMVLDWRHGGRLIWRFGGSRFWSDNKKMII